ncbi:ATP-binding protein [Actinomadura macra]|uniref:ATP-binding protein n=1 Tax=Actinomadura macra TaxID=46164 RepID=UPI00082FD88C|nr:ATP-binding protein [Actinomadura macra]
MTPDGDLFVLVLKPVPEACKEARDLVGFAFLHWGLEDYTARLVVSELITNAVRASAAGQHIVVRVLLADGETPTIEVWDQSGEMPTVQAAGPAEETGRGLFLVEQLVRSWGTRPLAEGGKITWARLHAVPVDGGEGSDQDAQV